MISKVRQKFSYSIFTKTRFRINKRDIPHVISITLQRDCVNYSVSLFHPGRGYSLIWAMCGPKENSFSAGLVINMISILVTRCSSRYIKVPTSNHSKQWSRNVHRQRPERSEIFIFSSLSLSGLSLARFKIGANILMAFAGKFFTEEIEDTGSL